MSALSNGLGHRGPAAWPEGTCDVPGRLQGALRGWEDAKFSQDGTPWAWTAPWGAVVGAGRPASRDTPDLPLPLTQDNFPGVKGNGACGPLYTSGHAPWVLGPSPFGGFFCALKAPNKEFFPLNPVPFKCMQVPR